MAAPKPPAISSRVVLAFFVAAMVGGLVFAIWYVTSAFAPRGISESELRRDSALRRDASASAPKPSEDTNDIPRGGVLRGPVDPLDPRLRQGYGGQAETIALLTQATLVRVNRATDQVEPWLAESWTSSNNNLTYVIKLRPNILWSDGAPLTAADVAAAVAGSEAARAMGKPLTARAISPMEVEVTLPGSFAPGLRLLDGVPIDSEHGGLGPFMGPYIQNGKTDVFERNPHYWRTAPDGKALPYLDRIELDPGVDPEANLKRLLGGELDFIETELRPEDYTALKRADQEDRTRLYNMGPGLAADVLWINQQARPKGLAVLSNETVRLAISTAINRREFCDAVYLGACDPVFGPVTPGNPAWFLSDLSIPGPDPALARAMLAGMNVQNPIRLSLLVARGQASAERGAAFLRDQLKNAGIVVDITPVEAGVLEDRRKKGTYDAIFGRVDPGDTDPALSLDFWIRPNAATDWQKRINELMLKQATSTDRVERVQLFADVQKLYAQHMPEIFIAAPYTYVATSLRVRNVKPSGRRPALLWNADQLAIAAR